MRRYFTLLNREVHFGFIVMLCAIIMLSSVLAMLYYTKTIDHQARIVTDGKIQTYTDLQCTQVLNSHDWGEFNTTIQDEVKILDFYLRNEGNVDGNVTWITLDFPTYNESEIQYETPSWKLYLVKVDPSEVKIKPENAITPDKLHLSSGSAVHLKFYLTAAKGSNPEDFAFQTIFNSQNN